MMATSEQYAAWIVKNKDKKGTEEFNTVAAAYKDSMASPKQPEQGFGERLDADINAIPRQLGLAARYGIEGVAGIPDIVAAPVIWGANKLLPDSAQQKTFGQAGAYLADKLGLPNPENPTERIVGDASRMLAGGGGLVKGAGMLKNLLNVAPVRPGVTQLGGGSSPIKEVAKKTMEALSARPELQAASALGSGVAGGYTRETGGSPTAQFLATLAGGILAPGVVNAGMGAVKGARNVLTGGPRIDPNEVTITIESALNNSGIKPSSVSPEIMSTLEKDVADAMKIGDVSGDNLKRLIDYRLVGANPSRGNITLTPGDVTRQKNLAKIGVNSTNPKLQELANQQNENVGTFISRLNELGASGADDAYTAGGKLTRAIDKPIQKAKGEINSAYTNARNQQGLDAQLDHYAFTQRTGDLLKQALLERALPKDVRKYINRVASGQEPLNVSTAEQFKSNIGDLQRGTNKGSVRKALGLVRQALDEAPLMQGQGQDAIDAFNTARGLNRNWMGKVEKTPALKAVIDEAHPDKFINKFVINADVVDLARLKNEVKGNPAAISTIKQQLISFIKEGAVGFNPDEVRVFSQSGLNKAIEKIGDQKLKMFLTKEEFDGLKALGRTARYDQVQPVGSAVNNSNSGALVASYFDDILKSLPFGKQAVVDPIKHVINVSSAKKLKDMPSTLATKRANKQRFLPAPLLLAPSQKRED
jgi:hypothetical protein